MLDLFCCVIDLVNNFEKLLIKSYYWSLIKTLSEIRFFVTFNENKLRKKKFVWVSTKAVESEIISMFLQYEFQWTSSVRLI